MPQSPHLLAETLLATSNRRRQLIQRVAGEISGLTPEQFAPNHQGYVPKNMAVGVTHIVGEQRRICRSTLMESHLLKWAKQMIHYTQSCDKLEIRLIDDYMTVRTPVWNSGFAASFTDLGGRLNERTNKFEIWAAQEDEVRDLLLYFFGSDTVRQSEFVDLNICCEKQINLAEGAFSFAGRKIIEVDRRSGRITIAYGVKLDCDPDKISARRIGLHWELKLHKFLSFSLRNISAEFAGDLIAAQKIGSGLAVSIK